MRKITKKIGIICSVLFAVSFNAAALDDQKIATFEPDATGEVGFSSYTVKSTSFFSVQPQVAANTLTTGINGSANCLTMTTGTTAVRYQTLSFLNLASSITPTMMATRKYMKIMVKRDFNGNKLNILANGTASNWNTANFFLSSTTPTIDTWVDVVIDLSVAKGTAIWKDSTITNLMIEPIENNSAPLNPTRRVIVCLDNIVLSDNSTPRSPALTTSATNVYSHSYTYGAGPSSEKSFTVSGEALMGNITLTPTAPYEISSTSGSGFTSTSLTLTPTNGSLATTTIYTRLAAELAANTYDTKNVVITTSGAAANVALWGWVNKAAQTITFDALADVKADAADFSPGATSATSAINAITYSSSDELVATIVDGKINPIAKGTTQITASQASSLNYNAATPVIQSLNVTDTSTGLMLSDAVKLTSISAKNNEIIVVAYTASKVNIYDINGSMMYSKMMNGSQTEIIPAVKPGVYCVLATDSFGKTQMSKILVK